MYQPLLSQAEMTGTVAAGMPSMASSSQSAPKSPLDAAATEARERASSVSEKKQQKAEKDLQKGNQAFKKKKYAAAVKHYTEALLLDPRNHVLHSNRAAASLKLNDVHSAIIDATKCVDLAPEWAKGYFRRGTAYLMALDVERAIPDLEWALSLTHSVQDGGEEHKNLVSDITIRLRQAREAQEKVERIVAGANGQSAADTGASVGSGVGVGASEAVASGVGSGGAAAGASSAAAAKERGNKFHKEGNHAAAIECYSQAINLASKDDPQMAAYYNNRAACYAQIGSDRLVVEDCTAVLSIQPQNVKALVRRATAYETLEKYEKALADFRQVMSIDPSLKMASQASFRISKLLRGQGIDPDKAFAQPPSSSSAPAKSTASARKLEPEPPRHPSIVAKETGNKFFKEGNYDEAIKHYTDAIEKADKKDTKGIAVFYCNRAACHYQKGNLWDVIEDCNEAMTLDESNIKALLRRANAFEGLDMILEALEDMQAVIKLDPSIKLAQESITRLQKLAKERGLEDEEDEEEVDLGDVELQM